MQAEQSYSLKSLHANTLTQATSSRPSPAPPGQALASQATSRARCKSAPTATTRKSSRRPGEITPSCATKRLVQPIGPATQQPGQACKTSGAATRPHAPATCRAMPRRPKFQLIPSAEGFRERPNSAGTVLRAICRPRASPFHYTPLDATTAHGVKCNTNPARKRLPPPPAGRQEPAPQARPVQQASAQCLTATCG